MMGLFIAFAIVVVVSMAAWAVYRFRNSPGRSYEYRKTLEVALAADEYLKGKKHNEFMNSLCVACRRSLESSPVKGDALSAMCHRCGRYAKKVDGIKTRRYHPHFSR